MGTLESARLRWPASLLGVLALGVTSALSGAFGAGCSSSSEDGSAPAPASTAPPSPGTTSPVDPGPDAGQVTPPGPTLTTVRVHYALGPDAPSAPKPAPGALSIRGSVAPLTWDKSIAVMATKPGLYTWTAADLKTEIELKPLLGETWSRGPNYRVKPGQAVDIYPHFFESHGTVTKKYPAFVSQKLPSTRGVWIYLPPTYVENTEARFGVLYMHDAQNLFSAQTAFGGAEWQVDEAMDAGAEDGTIRESIIVGVENTSARLEELTPTADPSYGGGKADQYLAMLTDEIKPMIDKDLRAIPAREQTGVMGSSLGGLVSAYAGVRRADVFGLVGAMSPSTWWDGKVIIDEVATTPTRPAKPLRVYVDSGDSGTSNDDVANTTLLAAKYRSVGYSDNKDLLHSVAPGAQHNETYWAARLPAALRFVLGSRPD